MPVQVSAYGARLLDQASPERAQAVKRMIIRGVSKGILPTPVSAQVVFNLLDEVGDVGAASYPSLFDRQTEWVYATAPPVRVRTTAVRLSLTIKFAFELRTARRQYPVGQTELRNCMGYALQVNRNVEPPRQVTWANGDAYLERLGFKRFASTTPPSSPGRYISFLPSTGRGTLTDFHWLVMEVRQNGAVEYSHKPGLMAIQSTTDRTELQLQCARYANAPSGVWNWYYDTN